MKRSCRLRQMLTCTIPGFTFNYRVEKGDRTMKKLSFLSFILAAGLSAGQAFAQTTTATTAGTGFGTTGAPAGMGTTGTAGGTSRK